MCTALVVREEYWDRQIKVRAELSGYQALHKLFKESEITPNDDFDTVCDKLENRMLYLNRKEYIRQEQYYKAQFKLAKISYNVMNHDRRC